MGAVPAIIAVDLVIGAHDRGAARIDGAFEMGQVYFMENPFADPDVNFEAGVFNAVDRKMLDGRHHILGLRSFDQGCAHFADMMRVLAIGLLRASPCRVAQQVDADIAEQRQAERARLDSHGDADPAFKINVPRRPARHGNRKARSGIGHPHASRAIGVA